MQPILNINLTTHQIDTFTPPSDWERDYLGGASLAARMLYDTLTPDLDPLSSAAPLLFQTGTLTGTAGPAMGRFMICALSPATGLWGESNCGGFWGPELRKAGYDGLLVTGQSSRPAYLWIQDGEVEIRDAGHLWGMETYPTQSALLDEVGDKKAKIAVIGPAGETRLPFALILTDHGRVAGRTGMGAVMGSKNLKAVAVRGRGDIPLAHPKAYGSLRSELNRALRNDNVTRVFRELGTAGVADYLDYLGEMPKKYFQSGLFDGVPKITGATMAETILTKAKACHACAIACGRVVRLEPEEEERKGPEYESIVGFGPNLLIDDLKAITRLCELCDRYGMDTISLSNTLGLAFSLFEKGKITEEDTGGLRFQWGDVEMVERLVHQMARGEGCGTWLGWGARAVAERFGAGEEAVQVNGLEVPYHDPRGGSGLALVYATSPRGACHNQSDYYRVDIGHVEDDLEMDYLPRQAGAEKSANVALHQNWRTAFNALGMCLFANLSPDEIAALLNLATGEEYTLEDILRAGERAWNLKRVINIRLGLSHERDTLPKPLLEPLPDGGAAGYTIPLEEMLQAYYLARDWDPETGYPSPAKLRALGLEWAGSGKTGSRKTGSGKQ